MGDVLEGKNVGQALKQHGIEGIKDVGRSLIEHQSGAGGRAKKKKKRQGITIGNRGGKKSKTPSIFEIPPVWSP
jgi:hypothetical protein